MEAGEGRWRPIAGHDRIFCPLTAHSSRVESAPITLLVSGVWRSPIWLGPHVIASQDGILVITKSCFIEGSTKAREKVSPWIQCTGS